VSKVADWISILLLFGAAAAFALGVAALGDARDLHALYWLVVGAVALRGSVDLVRPRSGAR